MVEATAQQGNNGLGATLNRHHIGWLLAAAHTFQEQDMPEQAATLLNFLRVFDRDNSECLKLLALVHFKLGDMRRSEHYIKAALALPLSGQERAALLLLRTRLTGRSGRDPRACFKSYIGQLARLQDAQDA